MAAFEQLRAYGIRLLHLAEPPRRTALAFAVGVFIAFSPTYGLHTLSVLFCTWAFRFNGLAVLAGSLINNPWTFLPILGATFWTGVQLTGQPDIPPMQWTDLSAMALYEQVWPYALPFFLGGFVLSLLGAIISYPLAYWLIATHRARRADAAAGQLPPGTSVG